MNFSSSSLTSPEGSRSRTFTSSPTSSLPTLSSSRVVSPDNTPLGLKQLRRSPREILEKKAKMMKTIGMMEAEENHQNMDMATMMVGEEKEVMVQLKLFYLGVINRMKDKVVEMENENPGRESSEEGWKMMEKELGELREKVNVVEVKKNMTKESLLMIRREMECLELVRKEEERKHLEVLISFQKKIKTCLTEISSLQSTSSPTPETVPEVTLYSKVFTTPSPPLHPLPPTPGGLLQFSNLFCLSGQLVQFCQGQHGSKLVLDRIREGTEPERNLVREELGLPGSLGLILETGNMFFRQVILTLVETDRRTRVEVVEEVKRSRGEFLRIENGEEFTQMVFAIAGERRA